jgi:hypothetical protein
MRLFVLFGKRKEKYVGEYAPEVLVAMDEYGHHDNPAYLQSEYEKQLNTKEFEHLKVIEVEVNTNKLMEQLCPKTIPVEGEIVKDITEIVSKKIKLRYYRKFNSSIIVAVAKNDIYYYINRENGEIYDNGNYLFKSSEKLNPEDFILSKKIIDSLELT